MGIVNWVFNQLNEQLRMKIA